ncbi:MAG TPA: hypothetical protein VLL48_05680, partial [Longimicrobiales bacterium]|nr:hypothetical protein [Longimicrobiales bacterium]
MIRTLTVLALALPFVAPTLAAQEEPAHVYLAYFKIGYADLDEWNREYWEYSVPILDDLQEEGVIQGYNQYQHDVGSDFNIRFAVRTYDWAALGTFWDEYLTRLGAAAPNSASNRMIVEHYDEIWDIAEVHQPENPAAEAYLYESTFRHNFADQEAWAEIWNGVAAPILQEAMDEGLLTSWVRLAHNTGGPHNSKVLYFFEEWDDIDDMFARFLGDMAEDAGQFERT